LSWVGRFGEVTGVGAAVYRRTPSDARQTVTMKRNPPYLPHVAGFTLLELLVVMVIIGLLAGYVAPRYFSQVGKSEIKVAQAQIVSFEKALDTYRLDIGRYPTTEQGLNALMQRPQNEAKWNGPYLQKAIPLDPWGKPYQYKSPGERGEFDLWSLGKDGQPGGTGENADVTSW
jgi:general secretion pathway protein G